MNLPQLIKKHNLQEGDEVVCVSTTHQYPTGRYTLKFRDNSTLHIHDKGTGYWGGTGGVFELPEEVTQATTQLPPVGFKFKFAHEFEEGFEYLTSEGKYGWENGDNLEVVYHTVNDKGDVAIVLNTEEDVLTSAPIYDTALFTPAKTKEEKEIEAMAHDFNGILTYAYDEVSCKELAKILYAQGYRKQESTKISIDLIKGSVWSPTDKDAPEDRCMYTACLDAPQHTAKIEIHGTTHKEVCSLRDALLEKLS